MKALLPWFNELTFLQFISLLVVANLAMYVTSWAGIATLQWLLATRTMNTARARASRSGVLLSLVILAINIGVGVPGWWL
ncbi:MAG: hypothetical protein K2X03_07100 [Bryobacteraceae bacterium]|nr:hypothetical protein [Bryobacteraceae bacterium]